MPDTTRYELGRPHPEQPPTPTHEYSLEEVVATVRKIPGLGRLAQITEMHQGDNRVVVAIPMVHEMLETPDRVHFREDLKKDADAALADIAKIKELLREAGITQQAEEGRSLSVRFSEEQSKTVYGIESREEHENSIFFAYFVSSLLRHFATPQGRADFMGAVVRDIKPSVYLLEAFKKSHDYQTLVSGSDATTKANLPRIHSFLESRISEIVDTRFTGVDSFKADTTMQVLRMLQDSLATYVNGERNVQIAGNVAKIFISNGNAPVMLELGAAHFWEDKSGRGRFNPIQHELKKLGCSCIVLMPHSVMNYLQKHQVPDL